MNGDTLERIIRFMEREEDSLPERVSNHMILFALREERDDRRAAVAALKGKLDAVSTLLEGDPPAREGLTETVARLERFRKGLAVAVSAVALAFLGGLGTWLLGLLIH